MKRMKLCHEQCMGKEWELYEKEPQFPWLKTPHVKTFTCLAEARKAMIAYIKNPDFKNYDFKIIQTKN